MGEERRAGLVELEERVKRLETTYESSRLAGEARLQNIERILERMSLALENLLKHAPFWIVIVIVLEITAIIVGFEGWRRP
jgi:hypothetical protein